MKNDRDWNAIVLEINKLTQQGKIEWHSEPANLEYFAGSNTRVEMFYTTTHNNRRLRLFKESVKEFDTEVHFTWEEYVCLEFVDHEDRSLWRFPRVKTLWDLLRTVEYQAADVDSAIDDLLSSESSDE